ncbi:uncharacterized protein LOC131428895 [Malaya genurostris]|uniref:uncharacterized protein LOC131428895 n=1 Tax=Malaya genurostris TaxID=325434 RepID=UPI0026F3F4A5|nr:uncharacterized protein LOC131428895 [Malaya genurostris]
MWWNCVRGGEHYTKEVPELLLDESEPEFCSTVITSMVTQCESIRSVFEKIESFRKLQRIFAYVLRFYRNCEETCKEKRIMCRYPTTSEMRESMKIIVKTVQHMEFASEIAKLEKGEPSKKFHNLSPFLDDGMLRVGGRLRHSNLPYSTKHQYILPHHNIVVQNLVRCIHKENLHVGPLVLLAAVRRQFWVTNARSVARKITRSCVQCFKVKPIITGQFMGDLPSTRCDRSLSFQRVGLDFAGPFLIKQAGRNAAPVKGYICVFVCMVTRGIHLEAVENLSTEAFIAALLRFVSRRGVPQELLSDNGTNFVGAKHELHDLYQLFKLQQMEKKIFEFCQPREIKWKMNPPGAPHMGGMWEAGVKSVKTILKRVCKTSLLTMVEFATLLCQIEVVLNSRPLYAHSDDPIDPEALTPGHFLID